jgi:hypothetical protein
VSEVHKENKAQEDEDSCSYKRYVVAPEHEEAIRNEEGDDDQDKPQENLWPPPTVSTSSVKFGICINVCAPILYSSSLVSSVLDANK